MNTSDKVLALVQQALSEVEHSEVPLSTVILKAIRVARLRNDFEALYWLQLELVTLTKENARDIEAQTRPHFLEVEFKEMDYRFLTRYLRDRTVTDIDENGNAVRDDKITNFGVGEIEAQVESLRLAVERAVTPTNLHHLDTYFMERGNAQVRTALSLQIRELERVLSRIRVRVHDYLSVCEQQLMFGQVNADIFERNRRYVQERLSAIAPDALEKMNAAFRRLEEGDTEARSHALESCRRLLKSLADALYPPPKEPVKGRDGEERDLTEDKYINRLWQFAAERVEGHRSGNLLLATVQDLGNRLDRLYVLTNKGVHAEVDEFEVNQCTIQTWMIVSDLLRLEEGRSAITAEGQQQE